MNTSSSNTVPEPPGKFQFSLRTLLVFVTLIALLLTARVLLDKRPMCVLNRGNVKSEIDAMSASFRAFKMKYGIYPPNFQDQAQLTNAWRKMFPRATADAEQPQAGLTTAEALVFWLSGFGPDPTKPITSGNATDPVNDRRDKFFDFAKDRLQGTYPKQTYVPVHSDMQLKPYVYFDLSGKPGSEPTADSLKPYKSDSPGNPAVQAGKFQIICAGCDNDYGTGGSFPSGTNMSAGDYDNYTNFTLGTIGESKR